MQFNYSISSYDSLMQGQQCKKYPRQTVYHEQEFIELLRSTTVFFEINKQRGSRPPSGHFWTNCLLDFKSADFRPKCEWTRLQKINYKIFLENDNFGIYFPEDKTNKNNSYIKSQVSMTIIYFIKMNAMTALSFEQIHTSCKRERARRINYMKLNHLIQSVKKKWDLIHTGEYKQWELKKKTLWSSSIVKMKQFNGEE